MAPGGGGADADPETVPVGSLVFGYGPMIPFVAAAAGAWTLPPPWPTLASELAVIWGAIILVFVAGVRRGFGFGSPGASTASAIAAMLTYFVPGGVALLLAAFGMRTIALLLLAIGFLLVIVLDRSAALQGNAPAHFARLRPPQMAIAVFSLLALVVR